MSATAWVTLPDIARRHGLHLDRLRTLVRRREDLMRLGARIGGSTAFNAEAVSVIVSEYRKRFEEPQLVTA